MCTMCIRILVGKQRRDGVLRRVSPMPEKKSFLSRFRRKPADERATEKPASLTPANDNPWYCLATIHGEQPVDQLDHELARKNCQVWNRWIGGGLNNEGGERTEFERNFANRTSHRLPNDPTAIVDFSNVHFDRPVNFLGFSFSRPADFSRARFSGETNFAEAQFNTKADFNSVTFSGETNFSRAQFPTSKADFSGAKFSDTANFRAAQFHSGDVDFQSTTFSGKVDFESTLIANVNFRSARFSDCATFKSASFRGTANFHSVIFSSGVDFSGTAEFHRIADFGSVTFTKMANFVSAKFLDAVDFNRATFASSVDFVNATFARSAIFASAHFDGWVPDFRGAKMHPATEWHDATWPKPPSTEAHARQQVYAYERLKQEMEQLKKHEDEQTFFRRELRARRRLLWVLPGEWLLNVIYSWASDYGNSFLRPFIWLLVVFAAGTAAFARAPIHCGAPMPIRLAIKLSFANIFVFLPDKREIMTPEMTACLSDTTRAISALQSVSGVVLLFLLGLALRNRFRMK